MNFHTRVSRCTSPSPETLIARAERLIPLQRERAADADRNARLAPETVQELREAGFFRILQPAHFGGVESAVRQRSSGFGFRRWQNRHPRWCRPVPVPDCLQ